MVPVGWCGRWTAGPVVRDGGDDGGGDGGCRVGRWSSAVLVATHRLCTAPQRRSSVASCAIPTVIVKNSVPNRVLNSRSAMYVATSRRNSGDVAGPSVVILEQWQQRCGLMKRRTADNEASLTERVLGEFIPRRQEGGQEEG